MTDAPVAASEPMMTTYLGNQVPARLVRDERKLEDEVVRDLVAKAEALREAIIAFKAAAFEDIDAFRALMAERYKVQLGARRGGLRLESFDHTLRIEISTADMLTFGPELQVAKNLVDECLTEWSDGADDRIRTIVLDAFDVGDGGKLRVDRILGLRQLNITDAKWVTAMQAIGDAVRVQRSRQYIRLYRRANGEAPLEQIVLDASRV
jgi:hypothetical protein